MSRFLRLMTAAFLLLAAQAPLAHAQSDTLPAAAGAEVAWRLLDYIAVDY
ncbi:MAG: hypothetical protein JHD15_24410, partial [Phenylobacterium sp.]|nr:hypothetical protein [Phenylobacterium sp.]